MTPAEVLAALRRLYDRGTDPPLPLQGGVYVSVADLRACAAAIEIIEEYIAFLDKIPSVSALKQLPPDGGAAPFESVDYVEGSTEAAAVAGETTGQRCGCGLTEREASSQWARSINPLRGVKAIHAGLADWLRCCLSARTRELDEARAQNASARQLLGHATRDCARDHAIAEAARKALRGTLEDEREMWRLVREETP